MRLFVAVELNERIKDELCYVQKRLENQGVKGRFTLRENMHLTLAFIGECKNPQNAENALSEVVLDPMNLELDGFGAFGDIYWIGIRECEALNKNVKRIRKALSDHKIPFDRKKFMPHITLVRDMKYDNGIPSDEPFPVRMEVEYITLMRSDRGKNGMIYTPVREFETE
ncbi:MAG: RNA 2',3'-cyclic phosphodiesterase [Lachnospiraceae bacterium]|nr:RNA 2',3'-cyclic phosphodiesterase [Lachnospiraceae bacterium]